MANKQTFTLQFDASLNVSQMKSALNSVQSELSKLKLPANITKGLQDTFQKLSSELKNFENISSGSTGSKNDLTKLENSANKILNLWDKLRSSVQNLGGVSGAQLEKLFPESVANNIKLARDAFKGYDKAVQDATKDLNEANKQVNDIQAKMDKIQSKEVIPTEKFNQLKNDIKAANTEIENLMQDEAAALQKVEEKRASLKDPDKRPGKILPGLEEELRKIQQQLDDTKKKRDELVRQKDNSITESAQSKALEEQNQKYQDALLKVQELKQALETLQSVGEGGGAQQLIQTISKITGVDISQFTNGVDSAREAFANYIRTVASGTTGGLSQLGRVMDQNREAISHTSEEVRRATVDQQRYDERMRDVQSLKSRIQYFFGLSNAINLVKRAIRGAFDTIKELDKAMTETAVVTDFSVSDMWEQLPEYTKRANELGVTTLAAYKAATLYYQQGLKTNEVNALSVETLKMARIAGLDAAEATDRMTNALRGFNMELNTANAQRVDDVYSELAANTASNVDEISTAMTKVASLAHNANMEFETTAAFLAQIIETTRESAETAGTALKTVVARFSEVKKLVDEGTLRGQDEEGQVVDVNKVSAALRTAGIDMNKYFLGEVGLDDIFMELASKWDSLTALQQRYIATQAAGSRQQSRFIALMSDYARTQELVGKAYKANGAAARQFEKTQESLESKLARLKNAWNEFLMGLSNNVVVKGAVDFLTNLLNLINKLTSAFGDGIGTLAKWGVVALGIFGGKALLSTGGLIDKALMGLLGGTGIGDALTNAGIIGGTRAGQNQVQGSPTASGQMPRRATVFGNIGGLASGLGSKVGSLFGADLTGIAAGLTGIATAIGAIGLAIGAGVAAYQLWLHLTPEGKLKQATKEAEKLQKTAKEAEDNLSSLKSLESTYQEKSEQVNIATTEEDRQKAVQERNEAVLDAIKENGSLAEYVVTEVIDNEITITINEDALANEITNAADALNKAEINAGFADARVSLAQAKVSKEDFLQWYRSYNLDTWETDTKENSIDELYGKLIDQIIKGGGNQKTIDKAVADVTEAYQKYISEIGSAKGQAEITYAKQLQGLTNNDEIINLLLPALSGAFDSKQFTGDELKSFVDLLSGPAGEAYAKALSLYLDKIDFSNANLTLSNIDTKELLGDLDLKELEKITNKTSEELETIIKQNIQRQKEQQQKVNTATANRTVQIGRNLGWDDQFIGSRIADILALSSFEEQKAIGNLLNSITNDQIAGVVLQNLNNSGLREWITSLNFSKPIDTLLELQKTAIETKNGPIHDLAVSLQQDLQFSGTSLLESFITSTDYESLTESLDKFIEENGKITSTNILELAESNKTLNNLLKTNTISAKALAVALKGIETGEIQIWDLNDAIIAALNSMDDLDSITKRTIDDLNSFDPGYDENDVVSFIDKVIENATGNIEKGAWGNNQMRNYMQYIFGSYTGAPGEEYENWLTSNLAWLEANKENMKSAWSDIASESKEAAIASGDAIPIWEENGEIIIEIEKETTNDLIRYLQEQKGLTEQQARMMIADYKNYSDDFALTLERNDLKNVVATWAEKAGEKGWYLDKDLQTLAKALGVDVKEINDVLGKLNPDLVKIDLGDGSPEDILGAIAKIQGVGGNVDLTNRPSIDTSKLKAAGWLEAGEGTATVYSSTFSNENGTIAANFTPILPNGEVLSPTELQNYAESVISGAQTDDLKLQIGSSFNGDDAIEQAEQAAESIHQIQGLLYTDDLIDWNGIKQAFSDAGLVEYFDSTMNQMLEVGDTFLADFGRGLEEVEILAGETATSAYTRAAEESADKALATAIGKAVVTALSEEHDIKIGADTDSATEKVNTLFALVNEQVNQNYNTSIQIDTSAATTNIKTLASAYRDLAGAINEVSNAGRGGGSGSSGGTFTGTSVYTRAKGGVVSSYSSGSYRVEPGPALTGEEGPEIVWNKDKGYAYVTGQSHPEIQNLQPGDRIFNAQETKKILGSVAKGGLINSYSSETHAYGDVKKKTIPGTTEDSDDYKKQSTWRNELDWLYDLMEDIAEYERQQNIIQTRNELALEDIASSGRDLYKLTREELTNLETQLDGQQAAQLKRLQQMGELQTQVNAAGYGRYMQWNQQDQTLEIDWDAIEAIQDKETYDEVVDWLNRMESVQDQIDDAEDAMWDIKKQIQELQQRYLQKYLDFQNRVLDAIVKQYQDQIDKLSEINDNVNDTNASILDSIQREIDLERQIRDNTDVESNIADMEARLAYLQRDTTGANATEIRQLQKQLDEARTSYGDTLIDQAVDRLAQSNEDAAAQREKQIELMQAQLDYWQESGGLWGEVEQLISTGFNGNGSLIRGSDLEKVLQNAENYEAMSQAQRDNWANELILETNQVGAHILELANGMNVNAEQIRALLTNLTGRLGGTPVHSYTAEKAEEKYATGGLNTYTGLAHLDGTPSAPEYVLNPEQTNAFLRLADVLPSIMGGDSIGGTTYGGDIYLNLSMHVDEIASDYDVDRIADRVKDILYDASSYRNVNTLNFIR